MEDAAHVFLRAELQAIEGHQEVVGWIQKANLKHRRPDYPKARLSVRAQS